MEGRMAGQKVKSDPERSAISFPLRLPRCPERLPILLHLGHQAEPGFCRENRTGKVGSGRNGVDPSICSTSPVSEGFHRRFLITTRSRPPRMKELSRWKRGDSEWESQVPSLKPYAYKVAGAGVQSRLSGVVTISPRPRFSAWTSHRPYGQQKQKQ